MEEATTAICPVCDENGKAKSGRDCPACKGKKRVTQTRYEQICHGMAQVENINAGRTIWSDMGAN